MTLLSFFFFISLSGVFCVDHLVFVCVFPKTDPGLIFLTRFLVGTVRVVLKLEP
jgi:hypothetical protein